MKKIVLALLLTPFFGLAQKAEQAAESTGGMKFEHSSWEQILAKAKAENKYIIMDCFTTWCGPCKFMDANIFPQKEAGDFFNASFLNVRVQFDSTANDNEEVKSWKKDMKEIEKKYSINAYPTYLIFDPNGVAVHRAIGSTPDAKSFIAKGKEALSPETQYYTQLRKYESGEKSPESLRKMALMAQAAYDMKNASKISAEYIATITDLYTKENIEFLGKFTSKSTDKGFAIMLEHPEKIDAVLGAGKAKERVVAIISAEELAPGIRKIVQDKTVTIPDYSAITENAIKKYPQFATEITNITSKAKISFYLSKKDWSNFKTEVVGYMNKNGEDKISPAELNSYAWAVFQNCKDMTCVAEALDWSRKSFKDKEDPGYIDTYANILHKIGKTKEAIEWEQKALTLADAASKKTYQETLDKMKKGEKTWAD